MANRKGDYVTRKGSFTHRRQVKVDVGEMQQYEQAAQVAIAEVKPLLPRVRIEYRHLSGDNLPDKSFMFSVQGLAPSHVIQTVRRLAVAAGYAGDIERVNVSRSCVYVPVEAMAQIQAAAHQPELAKSIGDIWGRAFPQPKSPSIER